jgi:all-trans-retinol 13,14-reductase
MQKDCDAIVIGSGIGGLACASILAQQHKLRVLVFEKHFKLGGYTHTFARRGKYEWDVGVHYVGEMAKGMKPRALLDYVTQGGVQWTPLPSAYDLLVFPGMTYRIEAGEQNLASKLAAAFPRERDAIEAYFGDVRRAQDWYRKFLLATLERGSHAQVDRVLAERDAALVLSITDDYFKRRFSDARLRAVAAGQWGDYGVAPDSSAFLAHANVVSHYRFGGWYPKGGSAGLAESMVPIIEKSGGRVLVNHTVKEILIERGRAVGVRVQGSSREFRGERDIFADVVISNVGAYNTYAKLLPADTALPFRDELDTAAQSMSTVTAYVGLRDTPRSLGFQGENLWLFSSYDHADIYRRRNELSEGRAHFCYLSFPSLKNEHAVGHTAELTAPIDAAVFERWAKGAWKKRGPEYEALKRRIADALIAFVECNYPGFRELVEFVELATPLSAEHFTSHRGGAIYGIAGVPDRYRKPICRVHTPVENLLLTGSDAAGHGVVGAAMGAVMTASVVLGPRGNFLKLLGDMERFSASLPA